MKKIKNIKKINLGLTLIKYPFGYLADSGVNNDGTKWCRMERIKSTILYDIFNSGCNSVMININPNSFSKNQQRKI